MKKSYKNIFDKRRRDLLKIFASAGITKGLLRASPLVSGMMISRWAEAQSTPTRSVVIYVPDGAIAQYWYPNSSLSSFPSMSQPYSIVASDCNFLRNMTHAMGGHGMMGRIINNSWGDDSFDVNMGRILSEGMPFKYVNLGVHSNAPGVSLTKDNGAVVPFEDNPFNAFNRLFGNLKSSGGSDPRLNVVDAHLEAVNALKTRLGTYEQQRLDSHLTAIEETQQRLIDLGGGTTSCDAATTPNQFPIEYATFRQQAELQADIIALALECNLTASCLLAFGNDGAEFTLPYLNWQNSYHGSIHGGNSPTYVHYQEMRTHLSSLSAYAINRLKQRGVLNSTIVCEVTDMGHGDTHNSTDVPLILAGGGGVIQRGVSNAGGSSYTNYHQLHTAAVALNAHQHPAYQGYHTDVIPGVLT